MSTTTIAIDSIPVNTPIITTTTVYPSVSVSPMKTMNIMKNKFTNSSRQAQLVHIIEMHGPAIYAISGNLSDSQKKIGLKSGKFSNFSDNSVPAYVYDINDDIFKINSIGKRLSDIVEKGILWCRKPSTNNANSKQKKNVLEKLQNEQVILEKCIILLQGKLNDNSLSNDPNVAKQPITLCNGVSVVATPLIMNEYVEKLRNVHSSIHKLINLSTDVSINDCEKTEILTVLSDIYNTFKKGGPSIAKLCKEIDNHFSRVKILSLGDKLTQKNTVASFVTHSDSKPSISVNTTIAYNKPVVINRVDDEWFNWENDSNLNARLDALIQVTSNIDEDTQNIYIHGCMPEIGSYSDIDWFTSDKAICI